MLTVVIALLCASCSSKEDQTKKPTEKHDEVITKAIKELKDYWEDEYDRFSIEEDRHFEIKNTRIITIKNNDIEQFENVKYLVEFVLYTNYMGSAPYYEDFCVYDTVVVYNDGEMEVQTNPIDRYRGRTYETDFSNFIKDIDDYCGYYNCVKKLK